MLFVVIICEGTSVSTTIIILILENEIIINQNLLFKTTLLVTNKVYQNDELDNDRKFDSNMF